MGLTPYPRQTRGHCAVRLSAKNVSRSVWDVRISKAGISGIAFEYPGSAHGHSRAAADWFLQDRDQYREHQGSAGCFFGLVGFGEIMCGTCMGEEYENCRAGRQRSGEYHGDDQWIEVDVYGSIRKL